MVLGHVMFPCWVQYTTSTQKEQGQLDSDADNCLISSNRVLALIAALR